MTDQTNVAVTPVIKPNTKAMEELLSSGYGGMTVAKAKKIIKERKEDPRLYPLERVEQAEAFLAAYSAKPVVISTKPAWKRKDGNP